MSTVNDNVSNNKPAARRSPIITQLNSARARIEDKYSAILDKYSRKKQQDRADRPSVDYRRTRERDRDHAYFRREDSPFVRDEKTLEPSMTRTVIKSPTSVILSEKAYPYVKSTTAKEFKREKTPGYHRADKQHSLLNSDTCRRYGRHKSGHAETRTRKVRPYRNGKSEQLESSSLSSAAALRLARPMKVEPLASKARNDDDEDPDKTPTSSVHGDNANDNGVVPPTIDTTEEETDPAITERAAKRKEIESLILKYAAMEETYAQLAGGGGQAKMRPSTTDIIASKYRKSARQSERKDALKSAMAASVVNSHADTVQNAIVSCRAAGFRISHRGCVCVVCVDLWISNTTVALPPFCCCCCVVACHLLLLLLLLSPNPPLSPPTAVCTFARV